MSYCEADNVVMIQSLSFSELCVSILSPVNLTQSWRSRGGWRGKIFYISWQLKPLNITWMDQTGGKNNFMVCPNYSRRCKNTTCGPSPVRGGLPGLAQCPVIPVTITMFSQPLLSKFLCITNLMIYSLLVQSRFQGKPYIKLVITSFFLLSSWNSSI